MTFGEAVAGADIFGRRKYSNENFDGRRGKRSGEWKSISRRMVSGAPLVALENMEDRVPPMSGRTHNRIRSPSALNVKVKKFKQARGIAPFFGPKAGLNVRFRRKTLTGGEFG
ncbi:hypothetical protein VNO77_34798 [Canavalia gladiata]|uniref:Uncharacterized protein n=1 Tax=Canavalia gladiata TaxID=3824 RepID=A0AAN9KHZ6_CANGL